jgi:CHASE3 domain sensor protein
MPDETDSDLLDSLIKRLQDGTAGQLDQRMREAPDVKRQEEEASQRRLDDMWMRERERQRAIAQAQQEAERQEQMLVRYVLIGVGVVILIIVIVAIGLGTMG